MSTADQDLAPSILTVPNATELIQRLGQDDLIENGRLYVLCLDAIRDRNPRRWPIREEGVRDYITREFQKAFLASDHLTRLDDVNFLLIQPTQSAITAQSKALTLLRIVLKFFLGEAFSADIKLNRITSISGQGLTCESVDVSGLIVPRGDEPDASESQSHPPTTEKRDVDHQPVAEGGDLEDAARHQQATTAYVSNHVGRLSPRLVSGDRQYEVLFTAEPIWSIKQQAIVSYVLRPLIFERRTDAYIPADLTLASTRDVMRLDLVSLAEAKRLLQAEGRGAGFALSVPINQSTLSSSTGRQAVQSALDAMKPYAASSLIPCIVGLEDGAPNSKIVELVSVLRSRCRAVVARASSLAANVAHWRNANLSGVSVDLHALASEGDVPTAAQLSRFAKKAEGVAPALIVYAAHSSAIALAAWSSGFTHVGGEILSGSLDRPFTAVRFEPKDLYRQPHRLSA